MRIFLAGASGAIGQRLAPLLRDTGHHVTGTTRSAAKLDPLREIGVEPVIVDVFDATALTHAVVTARPDIVIHQLTDLPPALAPDLMADALVRNARIRDEGTRNLMQAALAAGARRMIAQSIAWVYAPGRTPHVESDPLKVEADGNYSVSIGGVVALEKFTLHSPPLEGVVLRYGQLHGPGTARTLRAAPFRYMSMQRPMPHCLRSIAAHREFTTSLNRTRWCRATRRATSLAGTPIFGCAPDLTIEAAVTLRCAPRSATACS